MRTLGFTDELKTLLEIVAEEAGAGPWPEDCPIERVETFEERGYLTRDCGLWVRLASGEEFELTVVQRAFGEGADDDAEADADDRERRGRC